jgi:hypothetical protein
MWLPQIVQIPNDAAPTSLFQTKKPRLIPSCAPLALIVRASSTRKQNMSWSLAYAPRGTIEPSAMPAKPCTSVRL